MIAVFGELTERAQIQSRNDATEPVTESRVKNVVDLVEFSSCTFKL